jgi:hypothetical protein
MKKQLWFRLVLVVALTLAIPYMAHSWTEYEYLPCEEECCRGFTTDTPEPASPVALCAWGPQVKSCGYFYLVSACA